MIYVVLCYIENRKIKLLQDHEKTKKRSEINRRENDEIGETKRER